MGRWTDGQMGGWADGQMGGWADGRTGRWTDGQQVNTQVNRPTGRKTDKMAQTDRRTYINRQKDEIIVYGSRMRNI